MLNTVLLPGQFVTFLLPGQHGCVEFTATGNRSIRPQSRKTLRQIPLNLLADNQTHKRLFFSPLKRAKKVPKCTRSTFAVSKNRQQQFPRGIRGDSRMQEIPQRAHISGGDLRNFELWTAGIQSGAIQPASAGDVCGGRNTWHKYLKDAYCCCTQTFPPLQTLIFLPL